MNIILALLVLTIAFATGTTGATGDVRVDPVATGSPAEGAGIQVNDFDGLLRAIAAFGAVRTIAAPQILAS